MVDFAIQAGDNRRIYLIQAVVAGCFRAGHSSSPAIGGWLAGYVGGGTLGMWS